MSRKSARSLPPFAAADILVVPGRGGSDADHWQTHFEHSHCNARRVEQNNWDVPDLDLWAQRIAAACREHNGSVLAVAHSFGCLALVRAVQAFGTKITGALLVAPADPERFAIPAALIRGRLPCPSLLIASDNDPWLRAWQARELATNWGSRYLNLGLAGHINVASGFGKWPVVDRFAEMVWREATGDRGDAMPQDFFLPKPAWAPNAQEA
ncbi:MAG: alpha/beta hydrolase [Rhodocyclales bacterium]|nr:alpha/beta hydrolase [Rhodocyclales bacterium]